MPPKASILKNAQQGFIAYHKSEGKENLPTIIFLGGLMSDMQGTKAIELEKFCKGKEISFIRFDYTGHGESSGKFTDGAISIWKNDALHVIDQLTTGQLILIGSSLGGWISLLAALERENRIEAIVGIAPAPDFTEELIWQKMKPIEQRNLMESGIFNLDSEYDDHPYPVTKELIEDGRKNLILNDKIELNCPIRLIHGMDDEDVPCDISVRLSEVLTTEDICVNLVPTGDHRMSTPENISLLCDTLDDLLKKF